MSSVINYTGPDDSVECHYPGCTNRLRRGPYDENQYCSRQHREGIPLPTSDAFPAWDDDDFPLDPDPQKVTTRTTFELEGDFLVERHWLCTTVRKYLWDATAVQTTKPDPRCAFEFPLPSWMGPDQDDPCRCDLLAGHGGKHSCPHLRDEVDPNA